MKLLAIDIGNSKIAAGLVDQGAVVQRYQARLQSHGNNYTASAPAVAHVYDWCADQLALEESAGAVAGLVVTSVVPGVLEIWRHLWEGKKATRALPVHLIDHKSPFPFEVEIVSPESVGPDRYCNVAGAMSKGYSSAVIVDLGTANTYDLLSEGKFRGGLIAPGCETAHRAMLDQGALLPDVPFTRPPHLLGMDTLGALQAGSFFQNMGGILYVVHALLRNFGEAPILVTGGLAVKMAPEFPVDVIYHADLTLEGAVSIASRAFSKQRQ